MNPCFRCFTAVATLCAATAVLADERFEFDASAFERKPLELSGYAEIKQERFWVNRDGAFSGLTFPATQPERHLDRATATLKLDAKLSRDAASITLRSHSEVRRDDFDDARINRFDEAFLSYKPDPGLTIDAGKLVLKWGKGYAWNPVGFVERPKDPNDVELAREGYTLLDADLIRRFDGTLQAIAFTPVILPVSSTVNSDFGRPGHVNVAAKLYVLFHDTDLDLTFLSRGSRSPRAGIDFSRNLGSNLEVHGEWAAFRDLEQAIVNDAGEISAVRRNAVSYLLGLRYLTQSDTTWIAEYYHDGTGLSPEQMQSFFRLVERASAAGDTALLRRAVDLSRAGYGRPNPMRSYAYLRVAQKEPFDILYLTPAMTAIANLDDRSLSLTPELLYTGIDNLELRFRMVWLVGAAGTEFGERQNSRRGEIYGRFYF
jgi:hypothetical protein